MEVNLWPNAAYVKSCNRKKKKKSCNREKEIFP